MNVLMDNRTIARQYDLIANGYDSFFSDTESVMENREVGSLIVYSGDSVLDVGCGTGLLLDIIKIAPAKYRGVNPSRGMLSKFVLKHPEYIGSLTYGTIDDNIDLADNCDMIVSLFGSMSYVSDETLEELAGKGKKLFLMFYKPKYIPVTYIKSGVHVEHVQHTPEGLAVIFQGYTVEAFNNYLIVK